MITSHLRDRLSRDRTRLALEESERSEHSFDPNNAFLASPRSQLQPLPNLRPDQPTPQAQAQPQAQQPAPVQDQILAALNQLLQNQQRQYSEPAQPIRQPEVLQPQLLQPQPPLPPVRQPHTGGYPFRPQEPQQLQPQYQRPPGREHLQSGREYLQYAEPLRYGERPQPRENEPTPTVAQRTNAIKKAIAEAHKLRAERQVADALNMRNGPRTDDIHDLLPNSQVLV